MAPVFVKIKIEATKEAIGDNLPANYFQFEVLDDLGNVVVTGTNDASGKIHFPEFNLTIAKEYHYNVKEASLLGTKWITDDTIYPVIVKVTEDYPGLDAEIIYPAGEPHFINRIKEAPESCATINHRLVDLCVPVNVKPFTNIGKVKVTCCDDATVVPGIEECIGTPSGECNFTIKQRICVEIPVEFGADVTTEEVHISCDEADPDNPCGGCEETTKE